MFISLLRCVGKAVVVNAPKALLDAVPFGGALCDVARDALRDWKGQVPKLADRREEVEALARADAAAVRQQARAAADEVAADQPEAVRLALSLYLEQVPDHLRRSLRRPT